MLTSSTKSQKTAVADSRRVCSWEMRAWAPVPTLTIPQMIRKNEESLQREAVVLDFLKAAFLSTS